MVVDYIMMAMVDCGSRLILDKVIINTGREGWKWEGGGGWGRE